MVAAVAAGGYEGKRRWIWAEGRQGGFFLTKRRRGSEENIFRRGFTWGGRAAVGFISGLCPETRIFQPPLGELERRTLAVRRGRLSGCDNGVC